MASKTRVCLGAGLAAACGLTMIAQQSGASYTASQAQAGRAAYQTNCASCHAPDLSGREGPQLAGANFMASMGRQDRGRFDRLHARDDASRRELGHCRTRPTSISPRFILDANSARPGDRTLTCGSARSDPQRRFRAACGVLAAGRGSARQRNSSRATERPPEPGRRRVESRWRAKSRTTFRSPTPCCAIPIPATG